MAGSFPALSQTTVTASITGTSVWSQLTVRFKVNNVSKECSLQNDAKLHERLRMQSVDVLRL